jgi:large subunit ribosomal protein L23
MIKVVRIEDVLIGPIQTEKTVGLVGKVAFKVHRNASKLDIKKALKEFFQVEAIKVNITNLGKKTRMYGRRGMEMVKRKAFKKAIITLPEGVELNFNDFK